MRNPKPATASGLCLAHAAITGGGRDALCRTGRSVPGASAPDSGSDRHQHHEGCDRFPSGEGGEPIAADRRGTTHHLHAVPGSTSRVVGRGADPDRLRSRCRLISNPG